MFDKTAEETQNAADKEAVEAEQLRKLNEVRAKLTFTSARRIPDFDELSYLAQHAPEEFETVRQRLCERAINSCPSHMRKRLLGLQFVIDMERQRAKNPMEACLKISGLMHDSLSELGRALEDPDSFLRLRDENKADVVSLF